MKEYKSNLKMFELKKIQTDFPNVKITKSKESYEFIKNFYGDDIEIFESVFALFLNNANNTIGYAKISQGGITGTVVDVRIIAKYAVESMATSVIIAHNHPSGKTIPSEFDNNITKSLKEGLKILGIHLIDHLIITKNSYYSYQDEGTI